MLEPEALHLVHQQLTEQLPHGRAIRVLEAGGGSYTRIKIDRPQHFTVIDISPGNSSGTLTPTRRFLATSTMNRFSQQNTT